MAIFHENHGGPTGPRKQKVTQAILFASKLRYCEQEPEKECIIDGHKYSPEEIRTAYAKVQLMVSKQMSTVCL